MSHTNTITRKGRILSIKLETRGDSDADSSHLGEYSNQPGHADRTIERTPLAARGGYRYFIAALSGEDTGNPESVKEDYARAEALNRGEWCYVGIIARAEYTLPGSNIVQRLTSGGLWGVESDSGKEYIAEVEGEELVALRGELETIGFGKRQIDQAFGKIERVNM